MKTAFITGITGQDGSYLAELLLEKGYNVYGMIRRSSTFNTSRIEHIFNYELLFLRYGDMTDFNSIVNILQEIITNAEFSKENPLEIYNLAAQSHVKVSFELPLHTADADAIGVLNILQACRTLELTNKVRFYQASTSELYGKVMEIPQSETTPFYPRSPYAVAKLYAFWIVKNYRESYDMFACNGILFNHCSPRRGHTFLVRKVTRAVARIKLGLQDTITLGNLDSLRDWGHARDYVKAMWLMLQQEKPTDYVIATGKQYSIRQVVELAFGTVGITIRWTGSGVEEKGYDASSGKVLVEVSEQYFRPAEVDTLLGNPSKAKRELGWEPEHNFEDIVTEMVNSDLKSASGKSIYSAYTTV